MVKQALQAGNSRTQNVWSGFAERGRSMLSMIRKRSDLGARVRELGEMAAKLVDGRDHGSEYHLATKLLASYRELSDDQKVAFLNLIADSYGPEPEILSAAIAEYEAHPDPTMFAGVRAATESRCQKLIRRLNFGENGTTELVRMRADILRHKDKIENFAALDSDFSHVFKSWFNIGFLDLERVSWDSPARLLHKIIEYEAVHEITGWEDLQRRVEPVDRRCYAFFHPRMECEPLIFVEVALTREIPEAIAPVLADDRTPIAREDARTAVFYSISNCQEGLRGIPFGNVLIKRVVELLRAELPQLKTFVTLSPVPRFSSWVKMQVEEGGGLLSETEQKHIIPMMENPDWKVETASDDERDALCSAASRYFVKARTGKGKAVDPVARFHLGNGARLQQLNWAGDLSRQGRKSSFGIMVNYLYDLGRIDENAMAYEDQGEVAASNSVKKLMKN